MYKFTFETHLNVGVLIVVFAKSEALARQYLINVVSNSKDFTLKK
jgi:hypothetical protein